MERRLVAGVILAFVVAATAAGLALAAALPASGDDGPPPGDPATFVIRVVDEVVADDYATAWPSMYPPHQEVAPRDEYVTCELRTPVGWKLRSAEVLNVDRSARLIPGETERRQVAVVTLRLVIVNLALGTEGGFTHAFSAVADGSRWTWILTPARFRLYRDDACGDPVGVSGAP